MSFADFIKKDMKLAYGVTEPAAIALACSWASSLSDEEPKSVSVRVNSGIYKNALTCGIPNTGVVGNDYAAALGCWFGNHDKGLMIFDNISQEDIEFCKNKIASGCIKVIPDEISSTINIVAKVLTEHDVCEARITDKHTNVSFLSLNNSVILDVASCETAAINEEVDLISHTTLTEIFEFVSEATIDELGFIREAFVVNSRLSDVAFDSPQCTFTAYLLEQGGDKRIAFGADAEETAITLTVAAIEARVLGLNSPAMSIAGSGNHGIISSLPLYAVALAENRSEIQLLRATALSFLITMYIKQYSGTLSSLCGCAVAGGTGMACALSFLRGGDFRAVVDTLYNMASSIVGMICHGGNHGCVMKALSAVQTAFSASRLALSAVSIDAEHGIGDISVEQTMKNIGYIANPGMLETEKAIMHILRNKQRKNMR